MIVGGNGSSAIYNYQPSSRSWVKAGDLPIKRWQCACIVLPNEEIFVVGGRTKIGPGLCTCRLCSSFDLNFQHATLEYHIQ